MPQSLSAVYIHLAFSTKDRRPLLRDKPTRDALHSYLGGISKQLDCPPILVGGVEDHVHLLARFGRTITQAEWVKELKRVSNLWLKENGRDDRKSTRLNSSHLVISYAVFCLKKKNNRDADLCLDYLSLELHD